MNCSRHYFTNYQFRISRIQFSARHALDNERSCSPHYSPSFQSQFRIFTKSDFFFSASPDMIRQALDFEAAGSGNHDEIPPCVRNVILQQLQRPKPNSTHTIKMMKKLSKTINVPDDPSDPTAFTQDPIYCNVPKYKSR